MSPAGAAAVGIACRDDLGDQVAHLQALEGYQPVEVGEGDLAHEPVHGFGLLLGRGLGGVGLDAAEVLLQGGAGGQFSTYYRDTPARCLIPLASSPYSVENRS